MGCFCGVVGCNAFAFLVKGHFEDSTLEIDWFVEEDTVEEVVPEQLDTCIV